VLGLDQAVPLGLALNEALTNVFKHARREDRPGQVAICATRGAEGRVCIEVRDDGPGLPGGLDPERTRSLGMKLMFGLVRHQLGGELHLENAPEGVLVRICFQPHIADGQSLAPQASVSIRRT
jgi:two-component sensor histidine kinase